MIIKSIINNIISDLLTISSSLEEAIKEIENERKNEVKNEVKIDEEVKLFLTESERRAVARLENMKDEAKIDNKIDKKTFLTEIEQCAISELANMLYKDNIGYESIDLKDLEAISEILTNLLVRDKYPKK